MTMIPLKAHQGILNILNIDINPNPQMSLNVPTPHGSVSTLLNLPLLSTRAPLQPLAVHVWPLTSDIGFKSPFQHGRPAQIHLVIHIRPTGHTSDFGIIIGTRSCFGISLTQRPFPRDEPVSKIREVARRVEWFPPEVVEVVRECATEEPVESGWVRCGSIRLMIGEEF
jgi:hypothetical protein